MIHPKKKWKIFFIINYLGQINLDNFTLYRPIFFLQNKFDFKTQINYTSYICQFQVASQNKNLKINNLYKKSIAIYVDSVL